MQFWSEMNTASADRKLFRRPQKTPTRLGNQADLDLRRVAWHEAHSRWQERPIADLRARGFTRTHVLSTSSRREREKCTSTVASYPIMGNNKVEIVHYTEPSQSTDVGLVWINRTQYFKGVPLEVWNFYLGGCQICQKWLKEREGHFLSHKDIRHYQRIVMVLKETIELMAGIDASLQQRQFS
ncbi:MAG: hypothetical protein JOZ78_09980 [Chroococcidiopsidaceae cyanobacterium CP_BM_ER_R8_30]|nr:hypothetical protein [Chroococcidiopsidaceae cyanobacterium CP_BM_ER_R8_30]